VRTAGIVEPRAQPLDAPNRDPDRAQHRTLVTGEEALRAENGAKMQPVPQRDRGDGLPYTKRVSRLGRNRVVWLIDFSGPIIRAQDPTTRQRIRSSGSKCRQLSV
jgi:hypothetical protein